MFRRREFVRFITYWSTNGLWNIHKHHLSCVPKLARARTAGLPGQFGSRTSFAWIFEHRQGCRTPLISYFGLFFSFFSFLLSPTKVLGGGVFHTLSLQLCFRLLNLSCAFQMWRRFQWMRFGSDRRMERWIRGSHCLYLTAQTYAESCPLFFS